jgi:hypothetical protein
MNKDEFKTQSRINKENDIYQAYKDLIRELDAGKNRARGYSKMLLYEEIGDKFYVSGHTAGMIIREKLKSERSIIE